jgi:hypothetical protein
MAYEWEKDPQTGKLTTQQTYKPPASPKPGYQVFDDLRTWNPAQPPQSQAVGGLVGTHAGTRWQPEYAPSFWENPRNVAQMYWLMKQRVQTIGEPGVQSIRPPSGLAQQYTSATGDAGKGMVRGDLITHERPLWIDDELAETITQAYEYFKYVNNGKSHWDWQYLHPEDPARQWLQGAKIPPPKVVLSPGQHSLYTMAQVLEQSPETWSEIDLRNVPASWYWQAQQMQPRIGEEVGGIDGSGAPVPTWMKIQTNLQNNPTLGGGTQMGMLGLIGGLIAGGPAGAAVGGLTLGAFGAGVGFLSSERAEQGLAALPGVGRYLRQLAGSEGYAADLMMAFDIPATWVEQRLGLLSGMLAEGADVYTDKEVRKAMLEASRGFYEARSALGISLGGKPGVYDFDNIFPAIEYGIRAIAEVMGADWELKAKDIRFAGDHEVWMLGRPGPDGRMIFSPEPVKVDIAGLPALIEARNAILAGANPDTVVQDMVIKYGFSGQMTDLVGKIALDPLNVMPEVTAKTMSTGKWLTGKASGKLMRDPFAVAYMDAVGPIDGFRRYRDYLRTSGVQTADSFTALQRMAAGLTEQGRLAELVPTGEIANPVKRWVYNRLGYETKLETSLGRWLANMTQLEPEAKARMFGGIVAENSGVLFDAYRGDPAKIMNNGPEMMVKNLQIWGSGTPAEAAGVAAHLGAPEAYTAQPVVKTFAPLAEAMYMKYDGASSQRALLDRVAKLLDEAPQDVLKTLEDKKGAGRIFERVQEALAEVDEAHPYAADIELLRSELEAGRLSVEDVEAVKAQFTGDKPPVQWHPDEFMVDLQQSMMNHAFEYSQKAWGLEPNGAIFRFFDTLKKAQSMVLLGYNPGYFVNNTINNLVTRAASGVFGLAPTSVITKFLDDFGVEPYRFEAGATSAMFMDEMVGKTAPDSPIGARVSAGVDIPYEKSIRGATQQPGTLDKLNRFMSKADKTAFSAQASRRVEVAEGRRAWYYGLKKTQAQLQRAGVGFEKMPPALEQSLRSVDPKLPDYVYATMEGAKNPQAMKEALKGDARRYLIEEHLAAAARKVGLDEKIARDTFAYLIDELDEGLKNAGDDAQANAVFEKVLNQADDWLDERLKEDIVTRVQEAAQRSGTAGLAEALNGFDDYVQRFGEFWEEHYVDWGETFARKELMIAQGAKREDVNALFTARDLRASKDWQRYNAWERATTVGMLEGLGFEAAGVAEYAKFLDEHQGNWRDYYKVTALDRRKYFSTKFKSEEAAVLSWYQLLEKHRELRIKTRKRNKKLRKSMDTLFLQEVENLFGPDAARGAAEWRSLVNELDDTRFRMMTDWRDRTTMIAPENIRAAWTRFLQEDYIPAIYEQTQARRNAMQDFWRTVEGKRKPTELPTSYRGEAMWNLTGMDEPVTVTGYLGERNGRAYMEIEGSKTGVPLDELRAIEAEPMPEPEAPPPPVEALEGAEKAEAEPVQQELFPGLLDEGETVSDMRVVSGSSDVGKDVIVFVDGDYRRAEIIGVTEDFQAVVRYVETAEESARVRYNQVQEISVSGRKVRNFYEITAPEEGRILPAAEPIEPKKFTTRDYNQMARRDMPDVMAEAVQIEAELMLDELGSGAFEGLMTDQAGDTYNVSSEMMWMKDLRAEGYRNRKTIENALKRLIDGKDTRDLKTLQAVREFVFERITGRRDSQAFGEHNPLVYELLGEEVDPRAMPAVTYGQVLAEKFEALRQDIYAYDEFKSLPPDELHRRLNNLLEDAPQEYVDLYADEYASLVDLLELIEDDKRVTVEEAQTMIEEGDLSGLDAWLEDLTARERHPSFDVYERYKDSDVPIREITPEKPERYQFMGGSDKAPGLKYEIRITDEEIARSLMDKVQEGMTVEEIIDRNPYAMMVDRGSGWEVYETGDLASIRPASKRKWWLRVDDFESPQAKAWAGLDDNIVLPVDEQPPAAGPFPPGYAENAAPVEYISQTEGAAWRDVRPLLEAVRDEMLSQGERSFGERIPDLPPDLHKDFTRYVNQVGNQLPGIKLATIRFAETLRDHALLNYSRRYGWDKYANILFPYQFWYTRSMVQWATRLFDRPAWFANYARVRNLQRNTMQTPGFPSRLRNRMAIPAPYLPAWAGENVWVDPVGKVFPIEEFGTYWDRYQQEEQDKTRQVEFMLSRMVQDGELDERQYLEAMQQRGGNAWETALLKVTEREEAEGYGSEGFLQTLLPWALYLTLPYNIATGKDFSPLPITRTGRALKTITEGTPLEMVGTVLGGMMSAPEGALREHLGLNQFGEWGDYYVDRHLANMVGDGTFDKETALQAMLERRGPAYDEAIKRVEFETAIRTPGTLPAYAALHGAHPGEWIMAMLYGWMPAGLLPTGELEARQLKRPFEIAREKYNLTGDYSELEAFFDEHPEYEARLALWDTPEERLRQNLITKVWDNYTALGSTDRKLAREQLGVMFENEFLAAEGVYDGLDVDTLAYWARALGADVPVTPSTEDIASAPDIAFDMLEFAPPEEAAIVDLYKDIRNARFPNWYAVQTRYFALPDEQRDAYLEQWPELEEYWEWNKAYKKAHPIIEKYQQAPEESSNVTLDVSFVKEFSTPLTRQLIGYYYADQPLSDGALLELQRHWKKQGLGENVDEFVDLYLRSAFAND